MRRVEASEVHTKLRGQWRDVLTRLGIDPKALTGKQGPCPSCGGKDRFCFDDRKKQGDYICRNCGAGDGFSLLMKVHGWSFKAAIFEVCQAIQMPLHTKEPVPIPETQTFEMDIANPTTRVIQTLRSSTKPENVPCVIAYLQSRLCWPLPEGHLLRASPAVDYFEDGKRVGVYPALIAQVHDYDGQLVTIHVTYLEDGRKLKDRVSRKILSRTEGRKGCAVRLMPAGHELGIGEGIESCLAWSQIHKIPSWAALNTALLQRFEPPPPVQKLAIVCDRDVAGLRAAWHLRDNLDMKMRLSVPQEEDWAAQLEVQHAAKNALGK